LKRNRYANKQIIVMNNLKPLEDGVLISESLMLNHHYFTKT